MASPGAPEDYWYRRQGWKSQRPQQFRSPFDASYFLPKHSKARPHSTPGHGG
eukprot:CAMPEP_0173447958 /NCGR_PEP_ID=MMETSP1357-20121228/39755_1 /TAXON_ID=77926 /ORGANISM="Hemiselmis rufescens, Strain PCC563" /LENGTH=51 /DNA_ID=CAMNT_0014414399 /DNA_START=15 /DNA_END=166 /DNA_ORIENTATION=-